MMHMTFQRTRRLLMPMRSRSAGFRDGQQRVDPSPCRRRCGHVEIEGFVFPGQVHAG